jgi:hypothetical protein
MRSGTRTIFSRFVPLGFLMVDLVAKKQYQQQQPLRSPYFMVEHSPLTPNTLGASPSSTEHPTTIVTSPSLTGSPAEILSMIGTAAIYRLNISLHLLIVTHF